MARTPTESRLCFCRGTCTCTCTMFGNNVNEKFFHLTSQHYKNYLFLFLSLAKIYNSYFSLKLREISLFAISSLLSSRARKIYYCLVKAEKGQIPHKQKKPKVRERPEKLREMYAIRENPGKSRRKK